MEPEAFDVGTLWKMQSLSQTVCCFDPRLLNAEATPGELAWGWAKDHDTLAHSWCTQLWEENGQVSAWAWLKAPFRVTRPDGKLRTSEQARLVWQTMPNRPDLVARLFDWFVSAADRSEMATVLMRSDKQSQGIAAAQLL